MPSQKNISQLEKLTTQLEENQNFLLVDYAGMSVDLQTKLRHTLRETGATYQISKNTLLRLALDNTLKDTPQQLQQALKGPTAILFTPTGDPVSPTKALHQFIEENQTPTLKIGLLDQKVLTVAQINNLAQLPGKQELLSQLAAQLNAPISGFAQTLRANLQNLTLALKAIQNQKDQ